jgi:hypothetical protein
MITPFVVKVSLVKLVCSSVLMSCAFLKSLRKEVFVSPLVLLAGFAKLKVVASVKAAAKSSDFIKLFFKSVFDFFTVPGVPGMPESIPSECQLFAFVENQ